MPALNQQSIINAWDAITPDLIDDFGDAAFKSWLSPLVFIDVKDGVLSLSAPSRFMKDWVVAHYEQSILKHSNKNDSSIKNVVIHIASKNKKSDDSDTEPSKKMPDTKVSAIKNNEFFSEEDFISSLDPRYTFDNFVVAKSNELAYAASMRVTESDKPIYNPLFLHGGVGLGKTHLMHAIAWQIHKNHKKKRVVYLSAEKFMYSFIKALRLKDASSFKESLRNVDVLMIDDVQFIGGKDTTQEEFFHTFNALVDQQKQVIISADKSPNDLEKIGDRLKSRLSWGLVADIHPTTYELRLGILQSKVEAMNMEVDPQVLEFLAFKITSNVRELEGALNRIIAHATLIGRTITIDTTQEVLRDVLRSNERRLTIDDIQRRVCEFYQIKVSEMLSAKRTKNITKPRHVAMYLSKKMTTKSLPEIGKNFGGKDHTSVLHSVRKITQLIQDDHDLMTEINTLHESLR
ncbi:MAG: chromosomal replication initiator protein DnaA [Alphaproteobacteria bacterium CG_4_10_14_0_8_um_filter_37_21]|nr:MAG: chromosomal replication initiator protein DnaA [Alphaproteobacteria bacterium CG_4_10_14_0_8_um_filter_37_21]